LNRQQTEREFSKSINNLQEGDKMKDNLVVMLEEAVKNINQYYADGDPLDGDETEEIANQFLFILNRTNGNLSKEESK
jgi:hypothetical protein